jgi:hypothetical protein
MPTQIQLRRDTAADWTSNNPTLAAGEFGWESDSNRFKIGTGSAAWTSLEYADTLKTLGDISVNGSSIIAPSNGDLTLTTSGSGKVNISDAYTLPSSDGSANQVLQTNGSGVLSFGDLSAIGDFSFVGSTMSSPSNADITLDPAGTGAIKLNANTDITGNLTVTGTLDLGDSNFTNVGALQLDSIAGDGDTNTSITFSGSDVITIATGGSGRLTIGDGALSPVTDNQIDLGTSSLEFKDAYFDGTVTTDGLTVSGTIGAGGLTVNSAYSLPTADGNSGQVLQTDGSGTLSFATVSLGDLSIIGSSILAPSNADLTLNSSNGNVVIEGIRVAGTTLSTEDSSTGIQVAGNLIPSQDGVFQLGSASRRWQTAYLAAETIDLGGATIKSDGSGELTIAATGATLPTGSKVGQQALVLGGKTTKTTARPVQIVKVFVSDGSTNKSDAQFLAGTADLELEFNGTVEDVPVFTEANQSFSLSDGTSLLANAGGATLFQF